QEPFSLIGFSGGPRICIGMAFSKMEMRLIAAHLLRKHQWDLLPDQNLAVRAFPSRGPKDGLRVYFRRWHQHD
ncbi:MAG TPA: cytochrome P450, partial [Herpetosiphonaceae bacterium]